MTANEAVRAFVEEARGIRAEAGKGAEEGTLCEFLRVGLEAAGKAGVDPYKVAQLYYRFAAWQEAQVVCVQMGVIEEALRETVGEMRAEVASYQEQAGKAREIPSAVAKGVEEMLGRVCREGFTGGMN